MKSTTHQSTPGADKELGRQIVETLLEEGCYVCRNVRRMDWHNGVLCTKKVFDGWRRPHMLYRFASVGRSPVIKAIEGCKRFEAQPS